MRHMAPVRKLGSNVRKGIPLRAALGAKLWSWIVSGVPAVVGRSYG